MRTRIVCLFMLMLSLVACGGSSASSTTTGDSLAAPLPTTPMFVLSVTGPDPSIVVIDTATHTIIKRITHPDLRGAREFAVTPNGLLYIALNTDAYRVYDEMLVLDAHSGAIVTRFPTEPAPMSPRWVGNHTVMVGHTAYVSGGFDVVLIDTIQHTITQRLKRPQMLMDAVTVGDSVYMAEYQGATAFLVTYDPKTNTITHEVPLSNTISNIVMTDDHRLYVAAHGKEQLGEPCNFSNGAVRTLDPQTGEYDDIGPVRLPKYPNGLTRSSATTVLVFDTCVDMGNAALMVFDTTTNTERTRLLIPSYGKLLMSQVTSQGEVAVFYEDGRIHWYDALTLEPRGHTDLPMAWISSMMLYPTEAKVR